MSRRRAAVAPWALIVLAVLALLAGACSGNDALKPLPPPPTTLAVTPTTQPVDYSGVALKPVPGRTTTTVVMGPGKAVVRGVVVGPDGAVPGATVRAERLVGDGEAFVQVATAADGTWSIPNVLGGRYRVRAWRPSDLALVKPEVFYLGDGEDKQLQLGLTRYTGLAVSSAIAPNPPVIGEPANLVVQVVQQSVDENGIVRGEPVPGARAELFGGGDWSVRSSNPTVGDGQGRAKWELECKSGGKQPLAVVVDNQQQFPLDLPACVEPPPETTVPPSTSTTASTTPPP